MSIETKSGIVSAMAESRARFIQRLQPLATIVGGSIPAVELLAMTNGAEDVRVEVGALLAKLAGILGGEAEALAAVGDEAPHLLALMGGMVDGEPIQVAGQALHDALWTETIRDAMAPVKVGGRAVIPSVPFAVLSDAKVAARAFLALISTPG